MVLGVYFLGLHMCVYLRTRFQVSRHGGNFVPPLSSLPTRGGPLGGSPMVIRGVCETNSSFRVKWRTVGKA